MHVCAGESANTNGEAEWMLEGLESQNHSRLVFRRRVKWLASSQCVHFLSRLGFNVSVRLRSEHTGIAWIHSNLACPAGFTVSHGGPWSTFSRLFVASDGKETGRHADACCPAGLGKNGLDHPYPRRRYTV